MSGLLDRLGYGPWLRRARIALGGPARRLAPYDARAEIDAALRANWLVRSFYLIVLYFAFETQRSLQRLGASGREIDPLWPVSWVQGTDLAGSANLIGLGFLASSVAAVIWPRPRTSRALVALFYLQGLAFENSFGSINHYGHFGLWLAIVFAAMPGASLDQLRTSRARRRHQLDVFFLAQCLIALFYTLSGVRKAYSGFVVADGSVSSFAPNALQLLVAQKLLETGDEPLLADLVIHNTWLAWPAHLLVIYVELFALVAVFRPVLHRLWGALLITFHLLVWLVLGIAFPYQPVLVALLFVWSPFAPSESVGLSGICRRLPLFGDLMAWERASGGRSKAPESHR